MSLASASRATDRNSEPPGERVAELVDVRLHFPSPTGPVRAVDGVSATFLRGQATAIVGRSGSGKSSLIAMMALMRRPTSGRVLIEGRDTVDLPSRKIAALRGRSIGVVFQSFHLDATLTARENVALPWVYRGHGRRRTAFARAEELLDGLGVGNLSRTRPHRMSGGQRQRVAIARALFADPALLIADEPTGSLDEQTANEVAAQIFAVSRHSQTSVIVVTHDTAVAALADRCLVLRQGRFNVSAPLLDEVPS